eukprot:14718308-Ditylum_brightwellii.AAC.1
MTSTAGPYEAAVLAKMLFKTLSKVGEVSNYVELSKLRQEVYQNCAVVPSSLTGNNVHLGLVTRMLHHPIIKSTTIPLSVQMPAGYYRVDKKLHIVRALMSI